MSIVCQVICLLALGADANDSAHLEDLAAKLRAHRSRIEAVKIIYAESWQPAETDERQAKARAPSDRELLYSQARGRLTWKEMLAYSDGKEFLEEFVSAWSDNQTFELRSHAKTYTSDTGPALQFALPIDALGLRTIMTAATPLDELLKHPEISRISDEGETDGERSVTVTVGPGIPSELWKLFAASCTPETTLEITLAIDRDYAPLRIHFSTPRESRPAVFFTCEASSFIATEDAHGKPFHWPRLVRHRNLGGTTTQSIQSLALNPRVLEADFKPAPPTGFSIIRDGKLERPPVAVATPLAPPEDAVRLMAATKPPADDSDGKGVWGWRIALPIGLAGVLALVLWLRFKR